jgi:hypothetical protein
MMSLTDINELGALAKQACNDNGSRSRWSAMMGEVRYG